ncbi:cytochrome P450 [Aspergillus crustosus]
MTQLEIVWLSIPACHTLIVTCSILGSSIVALLLWRHFRVPNTIPRNIPRIPIWVNLYAMWYDLSVIDLYNTFYREPLEKHGAITIWFTGTWCVLVTHPEYIVDMFRHDEVYPKVGVNIRGKGSLMGLFVGENIINSRNPLWSTLASVMKPGLIKGFDLGLIHERAKKVPERLLTAQRALGSKKGVDVRLWMDRFAQDVMALCLFDFDLQALDEPRVRYAPLLAEIIPAIFTRWALYFPKLDLPGRHFFSRGRILKSIAEFDSLLDGILQSSLRRDKGRQQPKVLSQMLKQAYDEGRLTHAQFRANLRMSFMFGHDTTANLLGLIMFVLGNNPDVQERLRSEALNSSPATIHDLPYLTSVVYEVLRLYPPVTEMLNHTASAPALLGGKVPIQPGTWLGWNAYGVHTNSAIWGPDARSFKPERWGRNSKDIQANFRVRSTRGHYIPFSLHARKCLGQALVLTEVRLVLYELVRKVKWIVDPEYRVNLGGVMFTLPIGLRIMVEEIDGVGLE